jgi:hypothetical protein
LALTHIARINWDQLNRTTVAGRFQFMFGWVTVTAEDLEIWSKFPLATFALYEVAGGEGKEYRLGSVNLNQSN